MLKAGARVKPPRGRKKCVCVCCVVQRPPAPAEDNFSSSKMALGRARPLPPHIHRFILPLYLRPWKRDVLLSRCRLAKVFFGVFSSILLLFFVLFPPEADRTFPISISLSLSLSLPPPLFTDSLSLPPGLPSAAQGLTLIISNIAQPPPPPPPSLSLYFSPEAKGQKFGGLTHCHQRLIDGQETGAERRLQANTRAYKQGTACTVLV